MRTSVYALLMAFVLAIGMGGFASDAEAKRLGGSKSFGKSFSTSKSATSPTSSSTSKAAAAGGTTKKSGFLGGLGGGLLGGLLAGGLFAALMGSGAFDGISFGDILLFAVIGFLIYKFFFAKNVKLRKQLARKVCTVKCPIRHATTYSRHRCLVFLALVLNLRSNFRQALMNKPSLLKPRTIM